MVRIKYIWMLHFLPFVPGHMKIKQVYHRLGIRLFGFTERWASPWHALAGHFTCMLWLSVTNQLHPHMLLSFFFIQYVMQWCVSPWHALVGDVEEVHVPLVVLVMCRHSRGLLGAELRRAGAGGPALFVRGGICDVWLLVVSGSGELGCSILVTWGQKMEWQWD